MKACYVTSIYLKFAYDVIWRFPVFNVALHPQRKNFFPVGIFLVITAGPEPKGFSNKSAVKSDLFKGDTPRNEFSRG